MGDNNHDDSFTITARDLLQANATTIAGVLILLTLATSFSPSVGRPFDFISVLVVIGATAPFFASSVILVDDYQDKARWFRRAQRCTYWGWMLLFIAIVYFLGVIQNAPFDIITTTTDTTPQQ